MDISEIETRIVNLENENRILKNAIQLMSNQSSTDETFSTNQACKYMQVSRKRLDLWRVEGLLPAIQTGSNGRWLFKKKDLDNLWSEWNGYDISTREAIMIARSLKKREEHQLTKVRSSLT